MRGICRMKITARAANTSQPTVLRTVILTSRISSIYL
jgi:hypothetical protein